MTPTPETQLAAHVVAMLIVQQYKVYQEVSITIMGQEYPIDIVGILEDRVICTEVKINLNDKVIEQAERNKYFCNQSWLAVAEPKHISKRHKVLKARAMDYGIGIMYISPSGIVTRPVIAHEHDRVDERLIDDCLCERQTTGLAAGSAAGKRSKKDEWEPVRELLLEYGLMTASQIGRELKLSRRDRTRFINQAGSLNIDGIGHDNTTPARYFLKESA